MDFGAGGGIGGAEEPPPPQEINNRKHDRITKIFLTLAPIKTSFKGFDFNANMLK